MSNVLIAVIAQLVSATIFWGVLILIMGWYIRKQIKKSFDEHYQVKVKSMWDKTEAA